MAVPRTKTAVRALLGAHGFHPRKLHGQNFLVDGNLIDAIVRTAEVGREDCVLEVGTGTGILTDALADRAGFVLSCDLDGRLQSIARALRAWPAHVEFACEDVLAGKHRLNPVVLERWAEGAGEGMGLKVVSNLPYAVATPFLANLLWEGVPVRDAFVLVQKEAAERFTARTGTAEYGPVSVAVRLLAEAATLRTVGPSVFWPTPKVESALLHLRPRDAGRARSLAEAGLPGLLREAFRHRRKSLRKTFPESRLRGAGIEPGARPQEVEPEAWLRLLTVPPP
jgi:16S rRNA (adenine1518-N6/adenine1519-N6)-dimethyltransferase